MTLLEDFLAGLDFPPVTLLKRYLEDGIPEHLRSVTRCAPTTWCLKSRTKSTDLTAHGNEAYRMEEYEAALNYHSQSIATAPTNSAELALAYANRSAVLQAQGEYELCLLDTNRALDGLLTMQSVRTMLLERKEMAWKKLQEQNLNRRKLRASLSKIELAFQERVNVMDWAKRFPFPERANVMACAKRLCYTSEMDIDDTDLVINRSLIDHPAWETKFENTISENLSPKVHQRVDEEWGSVFVAADDIEAGEILSNDDFYALVVNECNRLEYCSYCHAWCKALIPCVSCSQDMYCSLGCREEAYNKYHETECKLLPLWGNISPSRRRGRRLYLRIFLTGTKQGRDMTKLLNDPQVYAALNGNLDHGNARYSSTDYLPILNRFWKLKSAKRQKRIKEVLQMFVGLRAVKFFGTDGEIKTECTGNILTGEELLATVLLAHNFSLGVPRCHRTAAYFCLPEEGKFYMKCCEIGAAFGPWHTSLNHSCNPNVTRLNNGRHTLIRSLRPIKAGEQICFSIGNRFFTTHTRKERQAWLKRLWGRGCSCVACVEDWPTSSELSEFGNTYLTSNAHVIRRIHNMEKWVAGKINDRSISEGDVKRVLTFCKTVRQRVMEPSYTIVVCECFLRAAIGPWANIYFTQEYIASLCDRLSELSVICGD